ncbi:MAG: molybdopterin-dependent oxidoreductase, partial [Deltaproteobacteria bacterium]|nr:molybdopterin-dependent oxidoreductase [Deltaproteobacteria bacterium]
MACHTPLTRARYLFRMKELFEEYFEDIAQDYIKSCGEDPCAAQGVLLLKENRKKAGQRGLKEIHYKSVCRVMENVKRPYSSRFGGNPGSIDRSKTGGRMKNRNRQDSGGDQWLKGWCAMCLQNDCGILVRVRDGVVVEIKGDPECPSNKGKLCGRGALACIPGFYSPFRIRKPLKRTNPNKGLDEDPGWVEIGWDEALDLVGSRLRGIRKEDPRKLVFMEGWGTAPGRFGREVWLMQPDGHNKYGSPFSLASGTPNCVGSHGPMCAIHYSSNLVHGVYPEQIADLQYCKYLVAPGRTVGPNSAATGATKRFLDAIDRGMKLVVIDPRCSVEASKAYRWIPIRPGTELAFALSMVHVILYELKEFDEWFVKNRTNGPYLIAEDGLYYRDPDTSKPMMWDAVANKAKLFCDEDIADPSLEGEFVVNGQKVRPAFFIIKEEMRPYTPEWAEKISTVPAEIIRTVSREFVENA